MTSINAILITVYLLYHLLYLPPILAIVIIITFTIYNFLAFFNKDFVFWSHKSPALV